jgi:hypothetical protein
VRLGPELPPGHVWPVPAGRAVLERIASESPAPLTRINGHVVKDMAFRSGGYRLHTRAEWRFAERERGRAALIDHVRRTARLGPLLAAGTTVALAADSDDAAALWHIVPDLPSLGAELHDAPAEDRPRHLARLATAYVAALRQLAREDVAIELDPHAFGEQDGRFVYLADRVDESDRTADLAGALLAPCAAPQAEWVDAYLEAIERALPATLTREDIAALGLDTDLDAVAQSPTRDPQARRAATRVRASLERCT